MAAMVNTATAAPNELIQERAVPRGITAVSSPTTIGGVPVARYARPFPRPERTANTMVGRIDLPPSQTRPMRAPVSTRSPTSCIFAAGTRTASSWVGREHMSITASTLALTTTHW